MKKLGVFVIIMLFLAGMARAGITFEVKRANFSPTEQAFKDIYGGGATTGGEISIGILGGIHLWVGGSFFTQTGELTFTGEETTVKIMPIGGGVKYFYSLFKFVSLYAGAGVNYYSYKEENPIGTATKGGIGFLGTAGIMLKVFKGLFIDAFGTYSSCKMQPADYEINIGGIEAGVGLGYRF